VAYHSSEVKAPAKKIKGGQKKTPVAPILVSEPLEDDGFEILDKIQEPDLIDMDESTVAAPAAKNKSKKPSTKMNNILEVGREDPLSSEAGDESEFDSLDSVGEKTFQSTEVNR
jgi:hypothetical protein